MKKKSFMIIGLGRFGISLIKELSKFTSDIICVDLDESRVHLASQYVDNCVVCDCTKRKNLEELGAQNIDHVIVSIGNNLQASILTTITLKEMGVKRITVRIDESEYYNVMERLGADEIIIPEENSGASYAKSILSDTILDYYTIDNDYGIVQISIPEDFEEKNLVELNWRNKFDISIVGILRDDHFFLPKATDTVRPGDIAMVVGKTAQTTKLDKTING